MDDEDGVGMTLAAAACIAPEPRVGSGTLPLTTHPFVGPGQAGAEKDGVYESSAIPEGLIFFHCPARLS